MSVQCVCVWASGRRAPVRIRAKQVAAAPAARARAPEREREGAKPTEPMARIERIVWPLTSQLVGHRKVSHTTKTTSAAAANLASSGRDNGAVPRRIAQHPAPGLFHKLGAVQRARRSANCIGAGTNRCGRDRVSMRLLGRRAECGAGERLGGMLSERPLFDAAR